MLKFNKKTNLLIAVIGLAASAVLASAANAQAVMNFSCVNHLPQLSIIHTTAADYGRPGMFWLALVSPDQQTQMVWTGSAWEQYQGGLHRPTAVYRDGMPPVIQMTVTPLAFSDGWSLYTGQGVLTAQAQANVATRRQFLNDAKPERVANGTWRADMDSDDQYQWSLIDRDASSNKKYWSAGLVQGVSACLPQDTGG